MKILKDIDYGFIGFDVTFLKKFIWFFNFVFYFVYCGFYLVV